MNAFDNKVWERTSNDVRSELAVERRELSIESLRSARALKNGKHEQFELVLELRFFHHNAEQGGNRRRQKCIRTAAESTKHKRVIAVLHAHAEDCANLIEHDLPAFGGKTTVLGAIRKLVDASVVGLAVETECCYGDNVALKGLVSKSVLLGDFISKEGNAGRINTAVVDVVGVADFTHDDTAVTNILIPGITELIQRLTEC